MTEFAREHFRRAASSFPTGVVVVTAVDEAGPVGLTCQSFVSQSLEPALVSVSIGSHGRSWPRLSRVSTVAVSVLSHNQQNVAEIFAQSRDDKFEHVALSWRHDVPTIANALATFVGSVHRVIETGDHQLVIIEVEHVDVREGAALTYFHGRFGELS
jgi:flavin reductase (DIM6/NTAB) family NADH-FMN oxidoreductase RutF